MDQWRAAHKRDGWRNPCVACDPEQKVQTRTYTSPIFLNRWVSGADTPADLRWKTNRPECCRGLPVSLPGLDIEEEHHANSLHQQSASCSLTTSARTSQVGENSRGA
jgi:hypothetical protein